MGTVQRTINPLPKAANETPARRRKVGAAVLWGNTDRGAPYTATDMGCMSSTGRRDIPTDSDRPLCSKTRTRPSAKLRGSETRRESAGAGPSARVSDRVSQAAFLFFLYSACSCTQALSLAASHGSDTLSTAGGAPQCALAFRSTSRLASRSAYPGAKTNRTPPRTRR